MKITLSKLILVRSFEWAREEALSVTSKFTNNIAMATFVAYIRKKYSLKRWKTMISIYTWVKSLKFQEDKSLWVIGKYWREFAVNLKGIHCLQNTFLNMKLLRSQFVPQKFQKSQENQIQSCLFKSKNFVSQWTLLMLHFIYAWLNLRDNSATSFTVSYTSTRKNDENSRAVGGFCVKEIFILEQSHNGRKILPLINHLNYRN